MKKKLLTIAAAAFAFMGIQSASAQVTNVYVMGSGTYGVPAQYQLRNKTAKEDYEIGGKQLYGGSIGVGYIVDCWRIEAEATYKKAESKEHKSEKRHESLEAEHFAFMLNGYYDYTICKDLSLYLGGGIGIARSNYEQNVLIEKAPNERNKDKSTLFAYQLMAGLTYHLSPCVDLFTGYKFFGTTKPNLHNDFNAKFVRMPFNHSVEVGIRYLF